MKGQCKAFTRSTSRVRRASTAFALASLGALVACGGGQPARPAGKELRTLRIEEPLPESPQQGLFSRAPLTHYEMLQRIAKIASDPQVSALLLEIGGMSGSWSQAADIEDALSAVKKAGKPVHCHFEVTDNVGYALLARACDRISVTPGGFLDLVGVSAELVYARELLDTVGVSAELIQIGRFKGAADTLTRNDMPDEVAHTMNAILDELQTELVSSVAAGRELAPARVRQLIDAGPFTSEQARSAGLVDDVGFDDEARHHAKLAGKAERIVAEDVQQEQEELGLRDIVRVISGDGEEDAPEGPRVVLAHLEGTIMRGAPGSFQSAHATAFVRAMRDFANDDAVKAVVLRIDSPGGSALASDLMWHSVRRVAKRKPVIVSLGDLAASGGYYVAAAGTEIVAQDRGLVGSIGVVGGKIVAKDLADRLGVHVEHLTRGEHADWSSPVRKWSADERSAFADHLRETYERFVARVAEGRNRSRAQIEPFAQGRLMTARKAREGGLVDREGGLVTALALARERAELPSTAQVQVWPEQPGVFQALGQLMGGGAETKAALLEPVLSPLTRSRSGLLELLLSNEGLRGGAAVLPYMLSLN